MVNEKTAIIIQARMGSTRLKGKILKIIDKNKTILDLLLENLKSLNQKIIIATTNNRADMDIIETANNHDLDWFRGDEDNVLKRYIDCANEYNISRIIRITSDNVFVQPELIKPLIENKNQALDYISYKVREKNVILTHWGLFGEYIKLDALKKIHSVSKAKIDLEHVTYYIYTHENEFNIELWDVPPKLNRFDIRLTIDTIEDFNICKEIVKYLRENNLEWHYRNILGYIDGNSDLKERIKRNIKQIEKV
ncbi:MAG: cytidylyltransferase domain-containing protein [Candidatus Hodarchaeales archaeon]|jgi:spore coat polysaccharide biosynthesis protein SpsF